MNNTPLPAGSTLGKSFERGIDINLGTYGAPVWQPMRRISAVAPTYPKTTEDVGTYDDNGDPNEDVTGRGIALSFTVQANRLLSSGRYMPEVEAILAAGKAKGEAAVLDIRSYHKPAVGTPNPTDAERAFVTVDVSRQNTGNSQNEIYAVTFTGKGSFEPIANPYTGGPGAAPQITNITPSGVDVHDGDLLTLTGSGLLGATVVTVDGDPAELLVINDSTIAFQLPVGDAGDVEVTVTTPVGTSPAYTLTRGT